MPHPDPKARLLQKISGLEIDLADLQLEDARSTVADAVHQKLGSEWKVEPREPDAPDELGRFFVQHRSGVLDADEAWTAIHRLVKEVPQISDSAVGPVLDAQFETQPTLRGLAVVREHPPLTEDPTSPGDEWPWRLMKVEESWTLAQTKGEGVLIAQPDTGYTDHPEIFDRLDLTKAENLLHPGTEPIDPLKWFFNFPGHGTGTASVIASGPARHAQNGRGVQGTAPGARLVPFRVASTVILATDKSMERLARAIDLGVDAGCKVISICMGGLWGSRKLQRSIRRAVRRGVIVVAAAGQPLHKVTFPGAYPEVITVAACDRHGARPWWSARGAEVDVTCYGQDVPRATWDDGTAVIAPSWGTSYATSLTSGVAALWTARLDRAGKLTGADAIARAESFRRTLYACMLPKVRDAELGSFGAGILDAHRFLEHDPVYADPSDLTWLVASADRRTETGKALDRFALNAAPIFHRFAPEATRSAARDTLAEAFGASPDALPESLRAFGREIAFHLATDPNAHAAVASRTRAELEKHDPELVDGLKRIDRWPVAPEDHVAPALLELPGASEPLRKLLSA